MEYSWKAYYLDEPLSQKLLNTPFSKITVKMLRKWCEDLLKKHYPVDKKKFSRMFCIIKGCFEYSDDNMDTSMEILWPKVKRNINCELIVRPPKPLSSEQVFTDEERHLLKKYVYEDLERYEKQSSTAGLQILFLLQTGLRIGECCGLKWSDKKGHELYIQRQADNNGVNEHTKTPYSRRTIQLTEEAERILEDVKKFNEKHGYNAEWIFQSNNPDYDYRLSYNAAARKLKKLCSRIKTPSKSPHKLRKTSLSALIRDPNINDRDVQEFAGHSSINTTHEYYNFSTASNEELRNAINNALSI